ncbi:class B sortase, LPKTxAVK-specific [Streptococcus hohhotensis]|jgi:sortase, srtB family|uniref:Class B sortase, LPKTxAVK-specific n=1 Tax=Streptococcus hohhotensis TaxID=2866998 RepID=A0ABT6QFU8_9STRE|nr:class B sortase, LPKTxAVK-specific [Streptococcus sp. IMAU 99199]MDI2140345.1 class B sortase, LPKTxAVK-specific [Streptococcus sp. IMAU 99199]MDU2396551.1 class B sortase, LPKTxAVK-specific [Streptococcus mitis]
MSRRSTKNKSPMKKIIASLVAVAIVALGGLFLYKTFLAPTDQASETKVAQTTQKIATTSAEEKEYLTNKFKGLLGTNSDTIAYVYAPGTELDEPVVQTTDNSTYLDKRFDGGHEPYMGTVFMDTDNKKDFSDRLTWLFGHARGSKVGDHRMFNDVNYYSRQDYFDEHPYVVIETPERKYYYEAVAMIIVPEETAFYRTSFDDDKDFQTQLTTIYETAEVKKPNVKVSAKDKYLVLSTCREEDETIRANLYLRQIPDSEMSEFVKQHKDQLTYKPTR